MAALHRRYFGPGTSIGVPQPKGNFSMITATMGDEVDGALRSPIRYATGKCSLGAILVAASGEGICAIFLGNDSADLARDLEDRFPRSQLFDDDGGLEPWLAKAIACVETPALGLDVPLDPRGTAFQQRVWQALREIPAGATASYRDIAVRIGEPTAARAVAQACAANAIAIAIPCHRVRRENGTLSGYRWGTERKRLLLDREAAT
jgi:AraC family transcriptional regulator of adaptative response/methylated-DNA-[protein]-cysteine methyltransferase